MGTLPNSEDPEMQHNAAFNQGQHCCKGKKILTEEFNNFFLIIT